VHKTRYETHITTKNHQRNISTNQPDDTSKKIFDCKICSKIYSNASGLWKHKKKCNIVKNKKAEDTNNYIEIQNALIEQQKLIKEYKETNEIQNVMQNIMQNIMHEQFNTLAEMFETWNASNNNNNNNQVKPNLSRNDTCGDTITITEFVKVFRIHNPDFEETGRLGNIEGMSEFFLKILIENDVKKN
jgi:hypothetical protein